MKNGGGYENQRGRRIRKQNPAVVGIRLLHQELDVATGTSKAQPVVVQMYPSPRLAVTAETPVAVD